MGSATAAKSWSATAREALAISRRLTVTIPPVAPAETRRGLKAGSADRAVLYDFRRFPTWIQASCDPPVRRHQDVGVKKEDPGRVGRAGAVVPTDSGKSPGDDPAPQGASDPGRAISRSSVGDHDLFGWCRLGLECVDRGRNRVFLVERRNHHTNGSRKAHPSRYGSRLFSRPPCVQTCLDTDVLGGMGSAAEGPGPISVHQLTNFTGDRGVYRKVANDMGEPSRGKASLNRSRGGGQQVPDQLSAPDPMGQVGDKSVTTREIPQIRSKGAREEGIPAIGTVWTVMIQLVDALTVPVIEHPLGEHPVEVQAWHLWQTP